jgi:hypothetical protein
MHFIRSGIWVDMVLPSVLVRVGIRLRRKFWARTLSIEEWLYTSFVVCRWGEEQVVINQERARGLR